MPATTLLPELRQIVAAADPLLPISDVRSLADIVASETASRRIQVRMLGGLRGDLPRCSPAIGIHGLLAFTVSQRAA